MNKEYNNTYINEDRYRDYLTASKYSKLPSNSLGRYLVPVYPPPTNNTLQHNTTIGKTKTGYFNINDAYGGADAGKRSTQYVYKNINL